MIYNNRNCNVIDWVAFVLVVIGALNWGLFGAFHFDLVARIFGDWSVVARIIYDVIGLAALWMIYVAYRCRDNCRTEVVKEVKIERQ